MPFPYFLYRNAPFPQDRYTLGKNVQLSFSFSEKSCKLYLLYPNFQDCATLISSKKQAKPARRSRHAPLTLRRNGDRTATVSRSIFRRSQKHKNQPCVLGAGFRPILRTARCIGSHPVHGELSFPAYCLPIVRLRESSSEAPGQPAPDLRYVPPPFPRDTGSRPWNSSSNNRSYPPG